MKLVEVLIKLARVDAVQVPITIWPNPWPLLVPCSLRLRNVAGLHGRRRRFGHVIPLLDALPDVHLGLLKILAQMFEGHHCVDAHLRMRMATTLAKELNLLLLCKRVTLSGFRGSQSLLDLEALAQCGNESVIVALTFLTVIISSICLGAIGTRQITVRSRPANILPNS